MPDDGDFFVRFWGVRGSIPCPGVDTVRYGGNTSCLEIRCGPHILILDGGSELRPFDLSRNGQGALDADVFFTHTHHDHICGWPYFTSLLDPATTLAVWCGHLLPDHTVERVLGGLLREPFMPVQRDRLRATVEEQKGCREWLVPSEVINRMEAVEIDEETSGAVEVEGAGHFSVSMIPPMPSSVTRLSLMLLGRNWPRQTEFDGA